MKWILIIAGVIVGLVALIALIGTMVSRDHRATSTISLQQPPESVWKVVRDIGGLPSWFSAMQRSERLPDRDGHEVWRQKMRGFDLPIIVRESTPARRLVTEIDATTGGAFGGTWTFELAPEAGGRGTRISVTEAGWIGNPIFRFLSRFVFGYYGSLDGYLNALGSRFGETVRPSHS